MAAHGSAAIVRLKPLCHRVFFGCEDCRRSGTLSVSLLIISVTGSGLPYNSVAKPVENPREISPQFLTNTCQRSGI